MIKFPDRIPLAFTTSSGPYRDICSPNDQGHLSKVQLATPSDIDFILNRLSQAQYKMNQLKPYERADILKKMGLLLEQESEKLAWLIGREGGKPLKDARVEMKRAQITLGICAEETLRLGGENLPMGRTEASLGHMAFTERAPIGPVLAISAFNHPINLLAHQIGCAFASGCAVILKPAPDTPLCAEEFTRLFKLAGLPDECLTLIHAEIPEIEQLVRAPEFRYVSFVGSAEIGWHLRGLLPPGTRLSLEHGGQAPAVVRADADLELAAKALSKGAFYHAGQVCISTQRIFVHESCLSSFLQLFKDQAKLLIVGDATCEETDVGPLIRTKEVVRIKEWIEEALMKGAKLELGYQTSGKAHQFLAPTILSQVPRETKLMNEEVFGPVVCVNSYNDEDELLSYLNSSDYQFEASLFTQDISQGLRLAKGLEHMTVVINQHNAYRIDWMPFGGHRHSGLGLSGVRYAMEEMTVVKQIILKI
jgi:acyl-CoA reductase-like NAD-dependent aldehyde dehydrogenase